MDELDPTAIDIHHMSLRELTTLAGVSVRTVRYYIVEELLPPPEEPGHKAYYTTVHLDRLRMINRLKNLYLPLKVIKRFTQPLDAVQVAEWLAEPDERLMMGARAAQHTLAPNIVPIRPDLDLTATALDPVPNRDNTITRTGNDEIVLNGDQVWVRVNNVHVCIRRSDGDDLAIVETYPLGCENTWDASATAVWHSYEDAQRFIDTTLTGKD